MTLQQQCRDGAPCLGFSSAPQFRLTVWRKQVLVLRSQILSCCSPQPHQSQGDGKSLSPWSPNTHIVAHWAQPRRGSEDPGGI